MRIRRKVLEVAASAAITVLLASGCTRCSGCRWSSEGVEPEPDQEQEPGVPERASQTTSEPDSGGGLADAATILGAAPAPTPADVGAALHLPPEVAPFHISEDAASDAGADEVDEEISDDVDEGLDASLPPGD